MKLIRVPILFHHLNFKKKKALLIKKTIKMKNNKENEYKKVWITPELISEDINSTEGKSIFNASESTSFGNSYAPS